MHLSDWITEGSQIVFNGDTYWVDGLLKNDDGTGAKLLLSWVDPEDEA